MWYKDQIVVLTRKKKNGFPKNIEIGDHLVVLNFKYNPDLNIGSRNILLIQGTDNPIKTFTLHESFVSTLNNYRDETINKILTEQ
tara:strand:- start:51628 stop:51882 length:255 start_codon:yes stop_codon:yes gene_type:complete